MGIGPEEINWLAVAASAVGVFLLGAVWYTALFGKLWQKLSGYTHEQIDAMAKVRPMGRFLGGMFAAYVFVALGMAALWGFAEIKNAVDGAFGGLFVGIIAAAFCFTIVNASNKRLAAWLIDGPFVVIACVGTGALLGGWR